MVGRSAGTVAEIVEGYDGTDGVNGRKIVLPPNGARGTPNVGFADPSYLCEEKLDSANAPR